MRILNSKEELGFEPYLDIPRPPACLRWLTFTGRIPISFLFIGEGHSWISFLVIQFSLIRDWWASSATSHDGGEKFHMNEKTTYETGMAAPNSRSSTFIL